MKVSYLIMPSGPGAPEGIFAELKESVSRLNRSTIVDLFIQQSVLFSSEKDVEALEQGLGQIKG